MENVEIAWMLQEMADLVELANDRPYKALAYRKAAREIAKQSRSISALPSGELRKLKGIGEHIGQVVEEILVQGYSSYHRELQQQVPAGLLQALAIPGLGPKVLRELYLHLGIENLADLEVAAKARKVRSIPGMGPKTEMGILRGIELMRNGARYVPIGVATQVAKLFQEALQDLSQVEQISVVGSLRRGKDMVADVDLLVATSKPNEVAQIFTRHPLVQKVLDQNEQHIVIRTVGGIKVELFMSGPRDFAFFEFLLTGSQRHLEQLQALAQQQGISIESGGLRDQTGMPLNLNGELDIYRKLGLSWIIPELREDSGEVEAARTGNLVKPIELQDIKGDLHLHSNWSDGVATIEDLVQGALERGYQYLAITDHSKSLKVAGGLSDQRLAQQHTHIRQLNAKLPQIQVLTGVEVDILSNGILDYDDELLERADVVVASIHSGFKQSGEQLTERALMAIKNPHVDILAHPTGRMLGRRDPYAIDIQRVFEAAAQYDTILEINASPDRLDLKAEHVHQAKDLGIKIAINTDAHDLARLNDMEYGVITGRRGWLTAEDVVNTWEYPRLARWLESRK